MDNIILSVSLSVVFSVCIMTVILYQITCRREVVRVRVVKTINNAVFPYKSHETDVGYDLFAVSVRDFGMYVEYDTGIRLQVLDKNYNADIRPRSSISKYNLVLCNSVGTIDPDYTGSIRLRFKVIGDSKKIYGVGDKIGQLVFRRKVDAEFIYNSDIEETERGAGGFGSSGT